MFVNKDKVYLDDRDEVTFSFKLESKNTSVTDIAEALHSNMVLRDSNIYDSHGKNTNIMVNKAHNVINFTVENYEADDSRPKNGKDRCTFDVELSFDKNNMVYGKASNFRSYYDDIFESALILNKPKRIVDLVANLDDKFGDFNHTSFKFNRDGLVYHFPVEPQEVEQDLVRRSTEKNLFENRKFNSNAELREVMDEFNHCKADGTQFTYIEFKNCNFKNINFDKFKEDFKDYSLVFRFCHLDNINMSKDFVDGLVYKGVSFERNVGVNHSTFNGVMIYGNECSFNECKFNGKCDLYDLQLSDFTNCEGLKNSGLSYDSNLVKEARYELGNEIYIEERVGNTDKPREFDLNKIQKNGHGVLFEEEEVSLFYEKNKDLLKDRVLTFIKDLSPEDMKVMTYDDKREFFRESLENDIAGCSFIVKTDGNEVFKDDKFYKEQYLSIGNMYDEISSMAVRDLLEENKIRHNAYGFYDAVEERKLGKPKGNRNNKVKQQGMEL